MLIEAACYAEGTRLATPRGEVAIEHLAVGDAVLTASGAVREVIWLGRRGVNCARHPRPWDIRPVRVMAGAFGPGLPRRDLLLSPDHALLVDGALIPVRYLLNGASIVQTDARTGPVRVTYWHLELASHDVVLAEGLPAETYLDTGNRAAFEGGGAALDLHPEFARRVWEAESCAPLVLKGERLARARAALLARLPELGFAIVGDAGLVVRTERGEVLEPQVYGEWLVVALPDGCARLFLCSRSAVPAEVAVTHPDGRRLGVALAGLRLDGAEVALDGPRLATGWHAPETGLRWSDGEGGLDVGGVGVAELRLVPGLLRYPVKLAA